MTKAPSILSVAEKLSISGDHIREYGRDVAKVDPALLQTPRPNDRASKLILVSAITPTPAGEGKTTTSIGLAQGLHRLGHSVTVALREPSLGPTFGRKGGATGGGKSIVVPSDRIDLHFTGDFHAITSAHNLLAAMIDNHLHFDLEPRLDPRSVVWPRVIDMNDRALREIVVALGGRGNGVARETGFEITAASEVMAAFCLCEGRDDLRERLGRIIVGATYDGEPVTANDLKATGAMLRLLEDAIWPNLVQTIEGVPAFVHGGPFANIAHGCNSVLATRMALHLSDYAITEAGFGFDLGGEKFFDIKCRSAGLKVAGVVLVATIRALKYHGGVKLKELSTPNPDAVVAGLANLDKHIENARGFGYTPVVALNRFADDADSEIAVVEKHCRALVVPFACAEHFAKGGEGAEDLAKVVVDYVGECKAPELVYSDDMSPEEKIRSVATKVYGADGIVLSRTAKKNLKKIKAMGMDHLPVCMAKTQASLSDNAKKRGRPTGFEITIREVQVNAAAGFLVVLTGELLRMPGLPKSPRAHSM